MDITLIIVAHNSRGVIRDCLESTMTEDGKAPCPVIVIDNASDDGTAELVTREFKNVLLLRNSENLGFAKAVNQALRMSKGDINLVLNPDTKVRLETIPRALEYLHSEEGKNIAILGCKLLNRDGSLQYSKGDFPTIWRTFKGLFRRAESRKYHTSGYETPQDVDWVTGAGFFVRKSLLEKINFLDENYFLYYEDVDLCYRAKKAGLRVVYSPCTEVVHLTPVHLATSRDPQKEVFIRRSHLYFYRKNYGFIPYLVLWLLTIILLILKSIFDTQEAREINRKVLQIILPFQTRGLSRPAGTTAS